MTQKISYHIRFIFPVGEEEREQMLPSIDLFLRALEEADRLIAGSLDLEMDYHRALKEMSDSYFSYIITLKLLWPRQILLGTRPDPESLRRWMNMARNALFESAGKEEELIDEIADKWDRWARKEGVADALLYTVPPSERLKPLLVDLTTALSTLGGRKAVTLH